MDVPKVELSSEDRARLRDLIMSAGWRVLTDQVWMRIQELNALVCSTIRQDHDFNQGVYEGFKRAQTWAEVAAKEPKEVEITGYPSEADLTSRKFVPFR